MIGTAVILAGGKGSRLAPFDAPKPLLPVQGVPIIFRLLDHMEQQGVSRAIVCVGYRARDVRGAIGHRRQGKMTIVFSNAGESADMGERLLSAREDHKIDAPSLVCYGDEIADVDLAALEERHAGRPPRGLVTFSAYMQALPFGVVRDGRICADERVLINIGFVLAEPAAWDLLHAHDGVDAWVNRVNAATQAPWHYIHEGKRATINTLAELARAEELLV